MCVGGGLTGQLDWGWGHSYGEGVDDAAYSRHVSVPGCATHVLSYSENTSCCEFG